VTGLNLSADLGGGGRESEMPVAATDVLCQAIAGRMCVTATYNGKVVTLAPHIVFVKHGDQFLSAVTIDQDGKKAKMSKLGTFKLAGLTSIAPTTRPFVPQRSFRADDPLYVGNTVCVLPAA
jgi:hypothetical protein